MSFPAYAQYRESRIGWLPRMPSHWRAASLRWLTSRFSGGTPDKDKPEYWENGGIPWLNSGAVNQTLITEPSALISESGFANSSAKWIPAGALVMALAGQGKTKGMVAQLAIRATCNQSMAAIVPKGEIQPRFLLWWLQSNYQNIRNMAGGDMLGEIPCPIPSSGEQAAIAAFLDRETAKIDALIAEQERLIDLLAEKRQAVISNAVTKGPNPDAPMEDSGVPWLGEVPAHWSMKRIKDCGCEIVDCKNRTPESVEGGDYFVVRTSCVKGGQFDPEPGYLTDEANFVEWTAKGRPRAGDVLFTREAPAGEACLAPEDLDFCLGQRMMYIRPPNRVLHSEFLLYSIYGGLARERINEKSKGSTVGHLRVGEVGELPLLLPPLEEQQEIVAHVNQQLSRIKALADESKVAIALMAERRSALIAAAVTGQIDVREAA
jgi:type I restriction enzyme S subunit